ncbi:hypothetical protein V1260_11355 [Brachybacterium sp. J144]|uniref:hypothetical protein n=1 Tax=Brachybacterium sp. J144 TaxID=3116487 RepID=UPI002E792299|nr:hypothetical protein [Brachybacterium sp. J144]MEE1651378.1 hypothetical protein [Brachybacterium sp. J144]
MPTLTMQSIADLTRVRREVVSVWRTRSTGSASPFPPSLSEDELLFDAQQIADWLQATGRGKNPEAPLEVLLHSSRFEELRADPEAASTLLLLHHLSGGPLKNARAGDLAELLDRRRHELLIPWSQVEDLLAQDELVDSVDELAEAAFSGRAVIDRLIGSFTGPRGPWAAQALTPAGAALVVEILRGLLEPVPRRLDPRGEGGMLIATELAQALADEEQPLYGADPEAAGTPESRAALRMLAAHAGIDQVFELSDLTDEPHIALLHEQRAENPESFFEQIDSVLLDLGPSDIALVLGPSELLLDPLRDETLRAVRSRLLLPRPESPAPLRYAARLPKGLSRFGGRRRLALWAFGTAASHAGTDWTVYGEHADTTLDDSARAAITADISAALAGGTALTAHAFLRSSRLATGAFVRRRELWLPPAGDQIRSGGESLARLWELDDGTLESRLEVRATDDQRIDPTVTWDVALRGLAREVLGTRLPVQAIGAPAPGSVVVIGPEEVRDPSRIGRRAVDRLVLEKTAPRSTMTLPGDVVFTAEGGAAAFVDDEGGHVLQAPARALRCRTEIRDLRVLHPRVVAADIAAQEGRDRRIWRLRTIPAEAVPVLDAVGPLLENRRADLRRRLESLDQLEDELIQAVAAGTLAATLTTPTKEN